MALDHLPFVISGDICKWDEKLKEGLKNAHEELKGNEEARGQKGEDKANKVIWDAIADKVVTSLKECDHAILNSWRRIYHHSLSLQGVNKQLGDTKAVVGQQAIGLAVGVPGGAAVGAGIYPLFKFCMKFFIK